MAASRSELYDALDGDPRVTNLYYCISSETLGLGNCQCNSHDVFGRRDGGALTPEDIEAFWAVVRDADDRTEAHPEP